MKTVLSSLVIFMSAAPFLVFGQCTVVPPVCVDISSTAYNDVILLDAFCCESNWDMVCQNAYDQLSASCVGYGCTDPAAANFNPLATTDDGSCFYPCTDCGCTDPAAVNYDPSAVTDDGSCYYPCVGCGCTDPNALNYDPNATINDGSCVYPPEDFLVVTQDSSPEEMVFNMLLGSGVLVNNVITTGDPAQTGVFSNGNTDVPFTDGLVLSTGNATYIAGSGEWGVAAGVSSDDDLLSIANLVPTLIGQLFQVYSMNDVSAVEFDFIPFGDNISFNYSFGSDEYLAFVNSAFNDAFGFFLSGPGISGPYTNDAVNIAYVPGTNPELPITVGSVNDVLNSQYYVHNPQGIAINGMTTSFTAQYQGLTPGETYHIRLVIGDGSDSALDSVVLLEAGSFTSEIDANGSAADFNGDGVINIHDILILLGDYGCVAPPECIGDLNEDGEVNFEDILAFLALFG